MKHMYINFNTECIAKAADNAFGYFAIGENTG